MDFFGYQQQARTKSRWLFLGVIAAAIAVVLALNVLVVIAMGWGQIGLAAGNSNILVNFLNPDVLKHHADIFLMTSAVSAALMSTASASKVISLKEGGGKVARQLGGDLVTHDHNDPLRRRLHNVVEEMSIASGVPVPEVFVLEHESGINAFAAGYTQSDAAIAVTRGALEKLSRNELQGVIAHEFSHILNGDMRINIRLMGLIFGILIISIIGRRVFSINHRRSRLRSGNGRSASATIIVGLGLMIVGYTGLFFARWLKASISRQREFLADASAIQFTRDSNGLGDALKKIAVNSNQSFLDADTEEVSHMLFGEGDRPSFFSSKLFATHPPLLSRIQRIEPNFSERALIDFGKQLQAKSLREHEQAQKAEQEEANKSSARPKQGFDISNVLNDIGHPSLEQILVAGMIADSLPSAIEQSAHSIEWAPEVMLLAILADKVEVRDQQLAIIAKELGEWSDQKIQHLLSSIDTVQVEQRLPLLEMAFPQLKKRPIKELEKLLQTIYKIISADSHIDSFEYLLYKLIELHIKDSTRPDQVQIVGDASLKRYQVHAVGLMSILAMHGAKSDEQAQKAFQKGIKSLAWSGLPMSKTDDWQKKADMALERLNTLKGEDKRKLVIALSEIIMHDGKVTIEEHELLRAMCAVMHIPLPVLT